jgi:hypothetical protein
MNDARTYSASNHIVPRSTLRFLTGIAPGPVAPHGPLIMLETQLPPSESHRPRGYVIFPDSAHILPYILSKGAECSKVAENCRLSGDLPRLLRFTTRTMIASVHTMRPRAMPKRPTICLLVAHGPMRPSAVKQIARETTPTRMKTLRPEASFHANSA